MFQGSLLPAVGINVDGLGSAKEILVGMAMTLMAATYLAGLVRHGTVKPIHLVFNGLCVSWVCALRDVLVRPLKPSMFHHEKITEKKDASSDCGGHPATPSKSMGCINLVRHRWCAGER